jgi:hypothetical protein
MDTFDTLSNDMKSIQEAATHKLAHFSLPKIFEHIVEQDTLHHSALGPGSMNTGATEIPYVSQSKTGPEPSSPSLTATLCSSND